MPYYHLVFQSFVLDDFSNPQVNSFTYDTTELIPTTEGAQALADWFYDALVNDAAGWKSIVQLNTDSDTIVVTAPQTPDVLAIKNTAVAGLRTGSQMPRFVAWEFKSERTRADIRAGFKRFGAVSETDTSGDVPTAAALTALNAFATAMSQIATVELSSGSHYLTPVIVKRIPYETEGGNTAYRLPNGTDPYAFSQAVNWSYYRITTQNSRKR